jgi:16S rRNA (uracil1498-N3)-methyltransferase
MVERDDRTAITTFYAGEEPLSAGSTLSLGEGVARHARVLRLGPGSAVRLVDGAGHRAAATLLRLVRDTVTLEVAGIEALPVPPEVHLLVPVAERDRMLWLAEKCTELGAATWRPIVWRRSRSVKPRGEGPTFAARVRARMIAALEQSTGARLPTMYPEAPLDRALAAVPGGPRILLDRTGPPLLGLSIRAPLTLAIGPEGGIEKTERAALTAAGFVPATLGATILRFETAAISALAIVHASLLLPSGGFHAS